MNKIIWFFICVALNTVVADPVRIECLTPCVCSRTTDGGLQTKCINSGFIQFPDGMSPHTTEMELSGNPISEIEQYALRSRNLSSVQVVVLQRCSIREIDRHAFSGLPKLYELNLSHNLLTSVPSHALDSIPQLRELVLSGNPVLVLENNAFVSVSQLSRLELADAQIKTVEPRAFHGLELLEWIQLDGNLLEGIGASALSSLRNLRRMDLQNNPWHCSCAVRPLKTFVMQNKVDLPIPPRCQAPARLKGRFWQRIPLEELACIPLVTIDRPDMEVFLGENVKLGCHVQASPPAAIMWLHDGKEILVHARRRDGLSGASGENYEEVQTQTPSRKESKKVQKGGKHLSKREVYGNEPDVTRLSIYEGGSTEKVSELHIRQVTVEDLGNYTCVGVNRGGKTSSEIQISVDERDSSMYPPLRGLGGIALLICAFMILCGLGSCCVCSVRASKNRKMEEDEEQSVAEETAFAKDIRRHQFAFIDEPEDPSQGIALFEEGTADMSGSPTKSVLRRAESAVEKKCDDIPEEKNTLERPRTFESSLREARVSLTESDHRSIPQRLGVLKRRPSNASDFSEASAMSHNSLQSLFYDEQRKRGVLPYRLASRRGSADIYMPDKSVRGIRFRDDGGKQKSGRLESAESLSADEEKYRSSQPQTADFPDLVEKARYYRDTSHDSSQDERLGRKKPRTSGLYRLDERNLSDIECRDKKPGCPDTKTLSFKIKDLEIQDFEYWLEQQKKEALQDIVDDYDEHLRLRNVNRPYEDW